MMEQKNEEGKLAKPAKVYFVGWVVLVVIVCLAAGYLAYEYRQRLESYLPGAQSDTKSESPRKAVWAQPVKLAGIANLHKVSDELYRGGQPSAEGMRQLEKLGVKTIVNLRSFHSDRDEMKGTKMGYEHIYMKTWHPEEKEVVRFLKIVADSNSTPVFVHCMFGADRTGTMCAIYRVAVQGWSKDEAIEEMRKGGFGFHKEWENLAEYVRKLDIDEMKRRAGDSGLVD